MIKGKYIYLHTALLSMLLFIGQMSTLVHAAEHPFHSSEHSCKNFLIAEKSANGLVCDDSPLTTSITTVAIATEVASLCLCVLPAAYSARAPPVMPV